MILRMREQQPSLNGRFASPTRATCRVTAQTHRTPASSLPSLPPLEVRKGGSMPVFSFSHFIFDCET